MRLVLVTPLYPPDVAWPAPYVKELAKRLVPDCMVTIVTYGRLPEQVPGVKIIAVDKRRPLPLRLISYTATLWRVAQKADVIYAQNGPSVELPLAVVNFFLRRPLVMHWGDMLAHEYAQKHPLRRMIERAAFGGAKIITDAPSPKPEILPFEPRPDAALAAWEASWSTHLQSLKETLHGT